ncbi:MAG: hypothetical protein RR088_04240 [Clostridia bacterium]
MTNFDLFAGVNTIFCVIAMASTLGALNYIEERGKYTKLSHICTLLLNIFSIYLIVAGIHLISFWANSGDVQSAISIENWGRLIARGLKGVFLWLIIRCWPYALIVFGGLIIIGRFRQTIQILNMYKSTILLAYKAQKINQKILLLCLMLLFFVVVTLFEKLIQNNTKQNDLYSTKQTTNTLSSDIKKIKDEQSIKDAETRLKHYNNTVNVLLGKE